MWDWYPVQKEREWKQSAKGNYVCIEGDVLVATVFKKPWGVWLIIINRYPLGRLVADEGFDNVEDAQARAEEILYGAPCKFVPPKSTYS